jgi:hypothetical protein
MQQISSSHIACAKLLELAVGAFKNADYARAGQLFTKFASSSSVSEVVSNLSSNVSTSIHDLSLPLGDARTRFKKQLDEDYLDDVETLEEIMPKNSEQEPGLQLQWDTSDNPVLSTSALQLKDLEDAANKPLEKQDINEEDEDTEDDLDRDVSELDWANGGESTPSISRCAVKINV